MDEKLKEELDICFRKYFGSDASIIKGTATFKDEEYFKEFGAKNRTGFITAWLPGFNEDGTAKIGVFFGTGQFIAFDYTVEQFLENFEVVWTDFGDGYNV